MPAWDAYKEEARSRGALAFELYVVISTPAGAPEAVKSTLPDHLAYQRDREADGTLAFAGPLSDETGTEMQGTGMIVYRATSFEAAKRLAENDPMHLAGARSFTIRKWMINEGQLTVTVGLSGQSVKLG